MRFEPRDPNAPRESARDFDYDNPCPNGTYEAVILGNEDGFTQKGEPKMIIRLGIPATKTRLDYHPVEGSWRAENLIEAAAPHIIETGGSIEKDDLKGVLVRARVKNEPSLKNPGQMRPSVARLLPLDGPASVAAPTAEQIDGTDFAFGDNAPFGEEGGAAS